MIDSQTLTRRRERRSSLPAATSRKSRPGSGDKESWAIFALTFILNLVMAYMVVFRLNIFVTDAMSRTLHAWQVFFRITLPILRPVIIVALLFRTIDALRVFDLIYVLTHGGPGGSTASVSYYAFSHFVTVDFGYGSAVAVGLFVIALVFSVFYVKFGRFSTEAL